MYALVLRHALNRKPVVLLAALMFLSVSGVLAISRGTAFMPEMERTGGLDCTVTVETSTMDMSGLAAVGFL